VAFAVVAAHLVPVCTARTGDFDFVERAIKSFHNFSSALLDNKKSFLFREKK
jgi:hypothetical protein